MASAQQAFNPYTITLRALADRWSMSREGLRKRFQSGQLKGFQEGRTIRIFMSEVQRIECQRPIGLSNIETPLPSPSENLLFEGRLVRLTWD